MSADPSSGRTRVLLPEDELRWRFSRSGGPGGQHVNTSDTRVSLSLDLSATAMLSPEQRDRALRRLQRRLADGVLTVTVQAYRSQARNRELARQRLTALISEAIAPGPPRRRATRPSRGAKERRLDAKRRRSDLKRSRSRRFDD
ncbi:ribosome-associated protein [Spinactinospora alkalitolerans]|uniref:Ribosome-associated protein n=1 Tax=Spinactinospora alkalitolerans TaxID=687207 RepID=A0A852TVJ9_9ACTN|nr:alternative ribosome rescue aminoacyl-tRNA hydrolase ArfB [Spinactinospora alkalitolerans]NYE48516.1 ribosome-associated protein [Spinactinospora alkalitolerans]